MRKTTVLLALLVILGGAALAGPPPESCTPRGGKGCSLGSDLLVFAEGNRTYEVVARITDCQSCAAGGPGSPPGTFTFIGTATVEFGPYDPVACDPAADTLPLTLAHVGLTPGAGQGKEPTYVPLNPDQEFFPTQTRDLRTDCVAPANMDYRIPRLALTGRNGALTQPAPYKAKLVVPDAVRAAENGASTRQLPLDPFRVTQALSFTGTQPFAASSTVRLWPDGLPFRLGPRQMTFRPQDAEFTTPGPAGGGPPAYTPAPPDASAASGLVPAQVVSCLTPDPAVPCSSASVSNAAYLHHGSWSPSGARFDHDGMSVTLDLAAGQSVLYEALFPRRMHLRLDGPAQVRVADNAIVDGFFAGGTAWLQRRADPCETATDSRRHALNGGALRPRVGPDGTITAGLTSLGDNLDGDGFVAWANSSVHALGCGTAFVPAALPATGAPHEAWLASAVPPVQGRGVYGGLNYNRTRVCTAAGVPDGTLCVADADCAPGASCVDAGMSPHCPADPPAPVVWVTEVEGHPLSFPVDPDDPTQRDRELAFYVRNSGVTGVFDGGDAPLALGDPQNGEFRFELEAYGTAYRASRSQAADTLVRGGLVAPWPADTRVPFEEMTVCDCGRFNSGRTPRVLLERKLGWWDQTFFPYGLQFTSASAPDCSSPASTSCGTGGQAASVCVASFTPLPRFEPDMEAFFSLTPDGQAGEIQPYAVPRLDFDADRDAAGGYQAPYRFDVETVVFQKWNAAGQPTRGQVLAGSADFGWRDVSGDVSLPYFGLTAVGLKLERRRAPSTEAVIDAHLEGGDPESGPSFLLASRKLAADNIAVPFRLDYFTPGATTLDDGTDEAGRGRGSFLAFAQESAFDLGAVKVASGLILRPGEIAGGDLGPAGVLRLWSNVQPFARAQLASLLPPTHLGPVEAQYAEALGRLGLGPTEGHLLPTADVLGDALRGSGALDALAAHPDASVVFNAGGPGAAGAPQPSGSLVTGFLAFSPDLQTLERAELTSKQDTGGQLYAMDGAVLTVERHVKEGEEPISRFTRREVPGASNVVALPGEQSIAFPGGGGNGAVGASLASAGPSGAGEALGDSPIDWDLDYDMPGFQFRSLTGSIDLTKGGLSGVGFDRLGATLKFYADGDWYFTAGMQATWSGFGAEGDILLGNTKDMTPLRDLDPSVADFLSGINSFKGAFLRTGVRASIVDVGCLLRLTAGVQVGGWFMADTFGGKARGWVSGDGACLVSVRGDLTLLGAKVNDAFRVRGDFWVGGGVGFCDPEDWDSPSDVLDDDWCASCVAELQATGEYPPEDLNMSVSGPDFDCSL